MCQIMHGMCALRPSPADRACYGWVPFQLFRNYAYICNTFTKIAIIKIYILQQTIGGIERSRSADSSRYQTFVLIPVRYKVRVDQS